jgi:hypothetical protein
MNPNQMNQPLMGSAPPSSGPYAPGPYAPPSSAPPPPPYAPGYAGASAPPMAPMGSAPMPGGMGMAPDTSMFEAGLLDFQMQYEINPKYLPYLRQLTQFDTVLVCDDSGSMAQVRSRH